MEEWSSRGERQCGLLSIVLLFIFKPVLKFLSHKNLVSIGAMEG